MYNEWQALKIETAAAAFPVTVDEMKDQDRIPHHLQDDMIQLLINAATMGVEKYLGRTLITTTYKIYWDCFYSVLNLPKPPLQSVTHVKYYDSDNVQQTLVEGTDYQVDLVSTPARVAPEYGTTWPSTRSRFNAVEIQYVAGYGDAGGDVPQPIKQLITAIAIDLYHHPETNIELRITKNQTYDTLAALYKIPIVY